jgi:hypothetical protein
LKAKTDVAKVRSETQELQLRAAQDVQAALSRYAQAKKWADAYDKEVVPNLSATMQEMDTLFANSDPSADLARVLTVQRAYLKAKETLLDARYELSQAEADLALAVAEPALALGLTPAASPVEHTESATNPPPHVNSPPEPSPAEPVLVPARALLGQPASLPGGDMD